MAEETRWRVWNPVTIARRLRVSLEEVDALLQDKERCPPKGDDGTYHLPALKKALSGGVEVPKTRNKPLVPRKLSDVLTLEDAKVYTEMRRGEMAQIRIDEKMGKLVPKADVERTLGGLAARVRSVLSSAAARYSPSLAAEFDIDAHQMRVSLDGVFTAVAQDIQSVLGKD